VGETITVRVVFVADYAAWGRAPTGEVGIVPLDTEDDPDAELPAIGDQLRVRVLTLLDPVGQEQHSDKTFDGRIRRVEFVAELESRE
jgi:hypothetical protein